MKTQELQEYKVRRLRREEIDLAVEWAHEEGWNPGLYDASVFYQTDPSGFWAGELEGEIVSVMSGVTYDDVFGFTGFYITRPEFRGQGYGHQLWNRVHDQMGARILGTDGVGNGRRLLEKRGYVAAHLNVLREGRSENHGPLDPHIVNLKHVPFERLDSYDQATFSARRTRFLRGWISRPGTVGAAYIFDGLVRGYGVIRPCRVGWKIGPLFANSERVADKLFEALAGHVPPGEVLYLDTPAPNDIAARLAGRYGLHPVLETTRMYRNGRLDVPLDRWFGVTSMELG